MARRNWVPLVVLLAVVSLSLAGCRGADEAGAVTVEAETRASKEPFETGTTTVLVATATAPLSPPASAEAAVTETAQPAGQEFALEGLPVTLQVPEGWARREITDGVMIVEDETSLAAPELECAALLVRRIPGATTPAEALATYDLSRAVRQREVPLVIARNPVDAMDTTLVSDVTGRVYQVVLAPLVIKGEALLFIASMPEGQADQAWPILATMLGSVELAED